MAGVDDRVMIVGDIRRKQCKACGGKPETSPDLKRRGKVNDDRPIRRELFAGQTVRARRQLIDLRLKVVEHRPAAEDASTIRWLHVQGPTRVLDPRVLRSKSVD